MQTLPTFAIRMPPHMSGNLYSPTRPQRRQSAAHRNLAVNDRCLAPLDSLDRPRENPFQIGRLGDPLSEEFASGRGLCNPCVIGSWVEGDVDFLVGRVGPQSIWMDQL